MLKKYYKKFTNWELVTEKSIREKEYPDKILERERKEGGFDRWIFHHLKLNMLMVWQM